MSETNEKPRVRVPAGSASYAGTKEGFTTFTQDSFTNLAAGLGYGAANQTSGSQYSFNPITRNHYMLDQMYRSSWIARQVVDAVADDMTRAGVQVDSDMTPEDIDSLHEEFKVKQVWQSLNATCKWARLYGGCLAYIQIAGQDPSTPLRPNTVAKGQFQGLMVLDRWMVWASTEDLVDEPGPARGRPKYYTVVADARGIVSMRIHHTRVIRIDGVELPFFQAMTENGWGISVIEPLFDRLIAFDSVSMGAAQLAYKAHLRVMKVEKLRELIATGGRAYQAFLQQMQLIRSMQTNEGMTVIDATDDFQVQQSSFTGLSDLLNQFGQQLSGAAQIPLTRLFGQSPNGMSATGESDLRTYYDGVNSQQENRLRQGLALVFDIVHRSVFGTPLPGGFGWTFKPLWLLSEQDRSTIAGSITQSVDGAVQGGLIGRATALKELRQSSRITGIWSNITDEDIKKAEEDDALPPPMPDASGDGAGAPGQPPAMPTGPGGQEAPGALPNGPNAPGQDVGAEDETNGMPSFPRRKNVHPRAREILKLLYPNTSGLKRKDIRINGTAMPAALTHDRAGDLPMVDFFGLNFICETEGGTRRVGHGWSIMMPKDVSYGYISGTSSTEGANEQFDAFLGPNRNSRKVWVISQMQLGTNQLDEYKAMLGFDTKEQARAAYLSAFDETGPERMGKIMSMDVDAFKNLMKRWPYHTSFSGKNIVRRV
jgi:uncharacterized protein